MEEFFRSSRFTALIEDERFKNQTLRTENIDALYQIVSDTILSKTSQEWLVILEEVDIPAGPVNSPEDLLNCPHLTAVKMFPEVDHPTEGRMTHKVPVSFSKTPGGLYEHAKVLGENTEQILSDLGLSDTDISDLYESGAIRGASQTIIAYLGKGNSSMQIYRNITNIPLTEIKDTVST
ncbi:MAG: hypothetical protein CM15mP62_01100 [Rhodospirillaceae bacterium]|nr:MAG: hypothetical protein CM15mP62_01100 [Rhodospirillaceae bacterium]